MSKALTPNARFRQLLNRVEARIKNAANESDLLQAIDEVRQFNGPLKFDNRWPGGGLLLGIFMISMPFWIEYWPANEIAVGVFGAGFLCAVVALIFLINRAGSLDTLGQRLLRLSSYFSNGLTGLDEYPADTFQRLAGPFQDYRRGNYSREISQSLQGGYELEDQEYSFEYHQLHYVNKRVETVTVTGADGKQRTETRVYYDHYNRFSLIVYSDGTMNTGNVDVISDSRPGRGWTCGYETSLDAFNREFRLSGESEMACARYARPPVVLYLLDMAKFFRKLNVEYASDGTVCISFDNSDLLEYRQPKAGLDQPEDFYKAVETGIKLPVLYVALDAACKLVSMHRDHFALSSPEVS